MNWMKQVMNSLLRRMEFLLTTNYFALTCVSLAWHEPTISDLIYMYIYIFKSYFKINITCHTQSIYAILAYAYKNKWYIFIQFYPTFSTSLLINRKQFLFFFFISDSIEPIIRLRQSSLERSEIFSIRKEPFSLSAISKFRHAIINLAPLFAMSLAVSLPIPDVHPVIITVFPSILFLLLQIPIVCWM